MIRTKPKLLNHIARYCAVLGYAQALGLAFSCTAKPVNESEMGQAESSSEDSDTGASVESTSATPSPPIDDTTGSNESQSDSESSTESSVEPSQPSESDESDCSIPQYVDDLEFKLESEISLFDTQANSLSANGRWALICAQNLISAVDTQSAQQIQFALQPGEHCTSLSKIDSVRILVTTQAGRILLLEQQDSSFELLHSLDLLDPKSRIPTPLFGSTVDGDRAWIAAGTKGVVALNIHPTTLEHQATIDAARDARDLVIAPSGELVVADGTFGICLLDPMNIDNPELSRLASDGVATKVIMQNDQIILLNGAIGFDAITLHNKELILQDFTAPVGPSLNADFDGDQFFVVGGSILSRYKLTSANLIQSVSTELRPRSGVPLTSWLQDIAKIDDQWWALFDSSLVPIRSIPNAPAPNIEVFYPTFFMEAEPDSKDEPRTVVFTGWNMGSEAMILSKVETSPPFSARIPDEWLPPRPGCDNQFIINPGLDFFVFLQFTPTNSDPVDGQLFLHSNDPDTPVMTVNLRGNPPGPNVGAPIQDFDLLAVGRERLRLSDYYGDRFILLKLFDTS